MQILAKLFEFTLKYVPKLFAIFYGAHNAFCATFRLYASDVRTLKSKYQTLLPHTCSTSMPLRVCGYWLGAAAAAPYNALPNYIVNVCVVYDKVCIFYELNNIKLDHNITHTRCCVYPMVLCVCLKQ